MDIVELFGRACGEFDRRVAAVQPDQWGHFTPCTEWDVRALVNHVAVEDLWVPPLLEGSTIEQVGDRFDGDQLGDDPQATWRQAFTAATAAATSVESVDTAVHVSRGDIPAGDYLMEVAADNLVHSWDLAIAVGTDTTLDPELVDVVAEWFVGVEDAFRAGGAIGERPPIADGADAQTRLLAMYGRTT
ncbi:MAG TPA: TIGR03086 family metal-binding protein [Jiangellaceae bacterium]|nr:TIGR03086 family metal-binding protein [Jiangellaceae bacterium]